MKSPFPRSNRTLLLSISLLALFQYGCVSASKRFTHSILPTNLESSAISIDTRHAIAIDQERVSLTKAYLKAHNHEFWSRLPAEDTPESIEFEPQVIVVHYTAITSLQKTVDYFAPNRIDSSRGIVADSGALNVGIQFIVNTDGQIYSQYPETVIARHTIGLNHVAIGIENIGNADYGTPAFEGKSPLTEAQLKANVQLVRYLSQKYPSITFLIAHYEYQDLENPLHPAHLLFSEDDPKYRTEKQDPGKRFMKKLRKRLREQSGG